jgi:hypothetical protein
MGDESGQQHNRAHSSEPPGTPAGTPENVPDQTGPFFLDDRGSNMAAHHVVHRAHHAAAAFSGAGGFDVSLPPLPLRAETPSLLLQTVIVAGEQTNEGRLIEAVIAYQLSWEKWKEIIAGAYKKAGFEEVILTPRSGDHGRDVIAIKKALGTIRVIDQVKAYKPGHLVTGEEVSALWGVMQGDKSSKGFLTTTSDFAPRIKDNPFIAEFIPSRLELVNGKMLFSKLEELARKT